MNRDAIELSARTAGGVQRYHTWPVLRPQTVAEHTWNVMRIWWQVYGPMSPQVSTYLLWHDAGEGQAGDVQFGAKRRYPELKPNRVRSAAGDSRPRPRPGHSRALRARPRPAEGEGVRPAGDG
jgi:hypothetical protein